MYKSELTLVEAQEKLSEWQRFDPAGTFDPAYMGRVKRSAVRQFKARIKELTEA